MISAHIVEKVLGFLSISDIAVSTTSTYRNCDDKPNLIKRKDLMMATLPVPL